MRSSFEIGNSTIVGASYWAEKGKRIIDERYKVIAKVRDVSSELGISPDHFHKVFGSAYRIGPKAYLHHVRIEQAKILLSSTTLQIGQVGQQVGFLTLWSFERVFKKLVGVCPVTYRKARMSPVRLDMADRK